MGEEHFYYDYDGAGRFQLDNVMRWGKTHRI